MSDIIDINVGQTTEEVTINVVDNVIQVNINKVNGGGGSGAVSSVNSQTGDVVLNQDNILDGTTYKQYSLTEKNKLAGIQAGAEVNVNADWNATSGDAQILNKPNLATVATSGSYNDLTNKPTIPDVSTLVPYTGATQDVDLGNNNLNAKGVKINGTAGSGHLGLKHQSANATAAGQETALFAGSDGELYYKNDGNTLAQIASRAWVNAQGFITSVITALGYTPANKAGDTFTGSISATNLSGTNTGDETTSTIKTKLGAASTSTDGYLTSTDWNTFNGKGNGTVTSVSALTLGTSGTDLSSSVATGTTTPVITLNVPTASATNRGVLSSTDWTTFNNKQNALSYTPYKFIQTSQTAHTGTTAETIMATATINGGTFNSSDVIKVLYGLNKGATTGAATLRMRINTSNTLSGAVAIGQFTLTATGTANIMKRNFMLNGGNLYGINFATTTLVSDEINTAATYTSTAYNTANTLFFFFTIQLANSGDSVTPNLFNIIS